MAQPASKLISPGEREQIFAPLVHFDRLLIAVSGGSDSLALLDLLILWRQQRAVRPDIAVATVDHRLRPDAKAEAAFVADRCRDHGLDHRILLWRGAKPATGLPAAARVARYRLLDRERRRRHCAAIVTAHTLDDQAETFLMRLARGSGLRGLSAMRFCAEIDGVPILRPLLGVKRERLRAHLRARGLSWRDDPSNEDQRFLRPRLRRLLPLLAAEGLTVERLGEVARKLGRADEAISKAASELTANLDDAGRLSRQLYREAAQEVRLRYLTQQISRCGGNRLPPSDQALEGLDLAICGTGDKLRRTLGHAIISAGPRFLKVVREGERKGVS